MRPVNIFAQRGGLKSVQSAANTWGELTVDLRSNNFDLSGLKAVVAGIRVTLESPDAILPTGPFTIHLVPIQIKAGAKKATAILTKGLSSEGSTTELKAALKEVKEKAVAQKDSLVIDIIGAYSKKNLSDLRETVYALNNHFDLKEPVTKAPKAAAKPAAKKAAVEKAPAKAKAEPKAKATKAVVEDHDKEHEGIKTGLRKVCSDRSVGHTIK